MIAPPEPLYPSSLNGKILRWKLGVKPWICLDFQDPNGKQSEICIPSSSKYLRPRDEDDLWRIKLFVDDFLH